MANAPIAAYISLESGPRLYESSVMRIKLGTWYRMIVNDGGPGGPQEYNRVYILGLWTPFVFVENHNR